MGSGFRNKNLFWVIAVFGVALDLVSKSWIFHHISMLYDQIPVIPGFFYITRVENPGGVFGWFQDFGIFLTIIRAIALIVILGILWHTEAEKKLMVSALGCLFAGAMGNLYDNLFNAGKVRDWLDFFLLPPDRGHFPTFNIADVLINVGIGLLILHEIKASRKKARAESSQRNT